MSNELKVSGIEFSIDDDGCLIVEAEEEYAGHEETTARTRNHLSKEGAREVAEWFAAHYGLIRADLEVGGCGE